MRTRWIGFAAAALIGFALRPALALDEVTYEASVDKSKVKLGENVQYLVLIHYGLDTMAPTVTPPSFDQFKILNEYQSTQESPGETDKQRIFKKIWLLQPEQAGHLSIAAALVSYQDPTSNLLRTGKTRVQFVDVETGAVETPQPASVRPAAAGPSSFTLWAAAGGGGVIAILAIWILTRRRAPDAAARVAPEERALEALQQAVGRLEQDNDSLTEYYAALTRTLLDYLQAKYALDANVLPLDALLAGLRGLGFEPEALTELRTFFQTAEKAKFAGYRPGEDEMIALHGTLTRFIESGKTRPARPHGA